MRIEPTGLLFMFDDTPQPLLTLADQPNRDGFSHPRVPATFWQFLSGRWYSIGNPINMELEAGGKAMTVLSTILTA